VKKRTSVLRITNKGTESRRIALGGNGLEPHRPCCLGRAVTDAIRLSWQNGTNATEETERRDSRRRGKDDGSPRPWSDCGLQVLGREERALDHIDGFAKLILHLFGETRALFGRSGQDDGDCAGLCDHGLGVTPGATLWQRQTMTRPLTFLGIESSCDDSAAAVVRSGARPEILSSVVEGQVALHRDFGGVVPEIAARAHAERLDFCVERALSGAGIGLRQLDGIAVTAGPGLIGGVLSGVMLAKGLAAATGLPLVGVNHLAGHALTPRLIDMEDFPYLMLLVSGGHCQFLIVHSATRFERLGGTIDDAPGEAFDKTAKILGLSQPGGPAVEAAAKDGDARRFAFPRPLMDREGCDMSFSGLKTAVLRARDALVAAKGGITRQDRCDICAGFQAAVVDVLVEKSRRAILRYMGIGPAVPMLAVAGGVAANGPIRAGLETLCLQARLRLVAPPLALCTDNAAMIAWAGIELVQAGAVRDADLVARPRWPLDLTAPGMLGFGKKGAKA
jgi:N6-L-threonylcarbamoyladenine synthase